jgi:hypothetical protein
LVSVVRDGSCLTHITLIKRKDFLITCLRAVIVLLDQEGR